MLISIIFFFLMSTIVDKYYCEVDSADVRSKDTPVILLWSFTIFFEHPKTTVLSDDYVHQAVIIL